MQEQALYTCKGKQEFFHLVSKRAAEKWNLESGVACLGRSQKKGLPWPLHKSELPHLFFILSSLLSSLYLLVVAKWACDWLCLGSRSPLVDPWSFFQPETSVQGLRNVLPTKHMELNLWQNPPLSSSGDLWKAEDTLAACLDPGFGCLLAPLSCNSCVFICCTWHHQVAILADRLPG